MSVLYNYDKGFILELPESIFKIVEKFILDAIIVLLGMAAIIRRKSFKRH